MQKAFQVDANVQAVNSATLAVLVEILKDKV
jgi:hypothetical protein